MARMTDEQRAERAARRAAQEAAQRAEADQWEAEKPLRFLHAMARANELDNAEIRVFYRYDNVLYYSYKINPNDYYTATDTFAELSLHIMQTIEHDLSERESEKRREQHLRRVKEDLLARLTDEEKEALGI